MKDTMNTNDIKEQKPKPATLPPFAVSPKIAAEVFGVCRKTIYTWLQRGKLNGVKHGWRHWVIIDEKYEGMKR
jgi:excisionase family DNA binding protein